MIENEDINKICQYSYIEITEGVNSFKAKRLLTQAKKRIGATRHENISIAKFEEIKKQVYKIKE